MSMKIIINDEEKTTIINKSKFIGYIKKVYTKEEIDNILINLKKEYPDATHICYAYILNNSLKYSDDGEPIGTAGLPILDCLEKNNLNYVLCIVTRYFGGIKLGAGGLLRAYSNSVSTAINNTKKLELIDGYEVILTLNYNQINEIDRILEYYEIKKKIFSNTIIYNAFIDNKALELLNNICKVDIIKEIIIRKEI